MSKYVCTSVTLDKTTGLMTSRLSPILSYDKDVRSGSFLNDKASISVDKKYTVGQTVDIDFSKLVG